jgi:hypothetical protein
MHSHTDPEVPDCFRQAEECAQRSNAQTDPKLKQQFLLLARLWLTLANRLNLKSPAGLSDKLQAPTIKREAEEDWGRHNR